TRDGAAASGQVWIDADTGAIVHTELRLSSEGTSVVLLVDFMVEPKLDMRVPERMTESYQIGSRRARGPGDKERSSSRLQIDATATYSDYRRFTVDTKTIIR